MSVMYSYLQYSQINQCDSSCFLDLIISKVVGKIVEIWFNIRKSNSFYNFFGVVDSILIIFTYFASYLPYTSTYQDEGREKNIRKKFKSNKPL